MYTKIMVYTGNDWEEKQERREKKRTIGRIYRQ
jgi:hypothetical protein